MLQNSVRIPLVCVSLAALLFIAYTDAIHGHRFSGVLCSIGMVLLVMAIPLAAIHPKGNCASWGMGFGRACAIALVYLLLVAAIYPRIGTSYYLKYNLKHESGTFVTYLAGKFGREVQGEQLSGDGQARHTYSYIEYGAIRKAHGKQTWTAPNGQLIREETWMFGVRHGRGTLYHEESGAVHVTGEHRHGERHGTWEVYGDAGELYARGTFERDFPVNATWTYYAVDGTAEYEGEYRGDGATFAGETGSGME